MGQRMEEQIVERPCEELSIRYKLAEVVPVLVIASREDHLGISDTNHKGAEQ